MKDVSTKFPDISSQIILGVDIIKVMKSLKF